MNSFELNQARVSHLSLMMKGCEKKRTDLLYWMKHSLKW